MAVSASRRFVAIVFLLCLDPIACLNVTPSIESLFDGVYSNSEHESAKTISSKSNLLNCTRACSFSLGFNDTFRQPANCSQRVSSFKCLAQVTILYYTQQIRVFFRTTGSEAVENGYQLYAIQQFLYIFNDNYAGTLISFVCFFADDCDWKYIQLVVKQFVPLDIDSLYYAFQALLYDPTPATTGIQCLNQNTVTNCSLGRCLATVDENQALSNTTCAVSSDPTIGLDIRRRRIFPVPPIGNPDTHTFICNRPLCNDDLTRNAVKRVMDAYITATKVPTPPSRGSPKAMVSYLFLIISLLVIVFVEQRKNSQ